MLRMHSEKVTFCGDSYGNLESTSNNACTDHPLAELEKKKYVKVEYNMTGGPLQQSTPLISAGHTTAEVSKPENNQKDDEDSKDIVDVFEKKGQNPENDLDLQEQKEYDLTELNLKQFNNPKDITHEKDSEAPEKKTREQDMMGDHALCPQNYKETSGEFQMDLNNDLILLDSDMKKERLSIHITKEESISSANDEDVDSQINLSNDNDSFNPELPTERTSVRSLKRPPTRSTIQEVPGGLRAKANTPTSQYNTDSPHMSKQEDSARAVSRESREEVFKRAMTLMSNRCTSARGEDEEQLFSYREPPYGVNIPQYFYINQSRPAPMSPLKVWRGYRGNVYFEPININRMNSKMDPEHLPLHRATTASSQYRSMSSTGPPTRAATGGRSTRAATADQLGRSYRLIDSSPQVFIMDKKTVITTVNEKIHDDIRHIESLENTGSLAVRPFSSGSQVARQTARKNEKQLLSKRDRLCRGTNYHQSSVLCFENRMNIDHVNKNSNKNQTAGSRRSSNLSQISTVKHSSRSAGPIKQSKPQQQLKKNFMVHGDRFVPAGVVSPMLRTTTQFSLGPQRASISSPEMYAYERLPPLDQVQINLRHMEMGENDLTRIVPYSRPSSYTEDLKPFIKYSPEVKAHYEQNNLNYC